MTTITSPTSGSTVSGTLTVTGNTTPRTVTASSGSTNLGTASEAAQSYSISVNTNLLANGSQVLSVNDGSNTASVTVTVNNTHVASPDGSTLNSATGTIYDNSGNAWTLHDQGGGNFNVYKNGAAAGYSNQVILLLWYQGTIWQENSANLWWPWSGSTWTGSGVGDPRPPTPTLTVSAPTSGFSLTSPITVSGTTNQAGPVTVKDGSSGPTVATLAVSNGSFSGPTSALAVGSHTLVVSAGSATSVSVSGTVIQASGSGVHFYGVNDHPGYPGFSSVPAQMAGIGVKSMRYDGYNTGDVDNLINNIIPALAPNISVYPMIQDWPGDVGATTETDAYNYGVTLGTYAAQKLAGKVAFVEVGNEWENNLTIANDGYNITDYSTTANFNLYRGAVRGFIAGWNTVDPNHTTKLVVGAAGWLHLGWLDGMWNGKAPDGTTGHPTARGDYVAWHWYRDMGDITNATGGSVSNINVLNELKTRFGVPIVITECGDQVGSDSEATVDAWVTSFLGQMVSLAPTYNIINVSWYERVDDSQVIGLYQSDGVTPKTRVTTMTNFISAHPMP
jgi:hypothetical protein